jgi:hypothetical protein
VLQLVGAGSFGFFLGWHTYFINRYRRGEVQLGDLVSLVGVLGGGGVLALFKAQTDLFGAYGVGLVAGFFSYFVVLLGMVAKSKSFDVDWFLDGRRKTPPADYIIPAGVAETVRSMRADEVQGRPGAGPKV